MTEMPWVFLLIFAAIMAPETLWWIFVTRPKNSRMKVLQERTRLARSIHDLEEVVFGDERRGS